MKKNYGEYDIIIFSYVATPLNEQESNDRIASAFLEMELICKKNGKILIIQDKFKEILMRKITRLVGKSYKEEELSQYVYSSSNSNEIQTYTYLSCLYSPKGGYYESQI